MKGSVNYCTEAIENFDRIYQEIENVIDFFEDPFLIFIEDVVWIIFNINGISRDITHIIQAIQGQYNPTDGGY